jgi:Ykl077w/Psg1 (Pma1 Stabilization in Golgi)
VVTPLLKVTWDPSFFSTSNTTIKVLGFYNSNGTDQAFTSSNMAAGWGFYQWPVTNDLLTTKSLNAVNVTIRIAALPLGSQVQWIAGPTVNVMYSPTPLPPRPQVPTGPALYIGLPTIFGFIAVMVAGTCIWNRHARKIGLGNIMSRGRHGYGIGKSRARRMMGKGSTRKNKEQGIQLMEREVVAGDGGQVYHDEPRDQQQHGGWHHEPPRRVDDSPGHARRDSDVLGSLAGSPTEDRHFEFPRQERGNNNAFRDELDRQERHRV